jgi:hypothetical protein|tara:strand:+ start:73 stop:498 length:426 start_codon:yes stop_codon:yes gene_type:complete
MNDDDLTKLTQARERVAPEHHHHDTLAREIEAWWGVTNGDEMVTGYGVEAVQDAHDKMQGFSPEHLDKIRNLGGYFRRLVSQNVPTGEAQLLGRTAPRMKREREAAETAREAEEQRLERQRYAADTPGTLEYRIKHGGNDD